MTTALMLFTRDLRVRDNPALAAAARADLVVPAFLFDDRLLRGPLSSPNRSAFLLESLVDLDQSLRSRGGALLWRRGDPARVLAHLLQETKATEIHLSADVSRFAAERLRRISAIAAAHGARVQTHAGVAVVQPGEITPLGGDHFKVFTPYFNRWWSSSQREPVAPPPRIRLPPGLSLPPLPAGSELDMRVPAAGRLAGGETAGRLRLQQWARTDLATYADGHDDLAGDRTSKISPYIHFGCLSATEVVTRLRHRPGGDSFARQLCWRDFYHQVTDAFRDIDRAEYRPRQDRWSRAAELLHRWQVGRTGYPIVDAGMRQLLGEGWMHNRARMITASFLVKDLYVDWRLGARHFMHHLLDGDIANNYANWQWIAGTGNDTRPNRVFSPLRQAERFDPNGDYVRRWVPELRSIAGGAVHQPWSVAPLLSQPIDYPQPIVDHTVATQIFLAARKSSSD